jgi:hypothetical protein
MEVGWIRMKRVKLLGGLVAIAGVGYVLVWWLSVGRFVAVA